VVILVATIATLISFSASTGLPFVPQYHVTVEVPDAGRLNVGAPVRVGGARVGVVKELEAVAPTAARPSFSRVKLAVDPELDPLPVDSRVKLRPISILGGKYLSIELGRSRRGLPDGEALPLDRATKTVDIDQALRIFEPRTRRAIQGTLTGFGNALAGRGVALNRTIASFSRLAEPLGRVAATRADPRTRLARFITASAQLSAALAPVGEQLRGLLQHGGPTLQALRGTNESLGKAIDGAPQVAAELTPALAEIRPVLDDATVVTHNLRAGTRYLPGAQRRLDDALRAALPGLRRTPAVAKRTRELVATLRTLLRDPSTAGSLRVLTQATEILVPLLGVAVPAQTVCNTFGLAARNFGADRAEGDLYGPFSRTALYISPAQTEQSGTAEPNLHYNPYGVNDETECETGNEPYLPGQHVGSPAGRQPAQTERTRPPAEAGPRARAAGLLGGAR
jgi:virulence factor Mce-like protein